MPGLVPAGGGQSRADESRVGVGRGAPASPLALFLSLLVWEDSASAAHLAGSAPLGSVPADSRALRAAGSSPPQRQSSPTLGACLPAVPPPGLPWCCPSLLMGVRPTGRGPPSWPTLGSQPPRSLSKSGGWGRDRFGGRGPACGIRGRGGGSAAPLHTPAQLAVGGSALPLERPRVWRPWQKQGWG